MKRTEFAALIVLLVVVGCDRPDETPPESIRVATFNLEDVRTDDLRRSDHPRLQSAARILQRIRPDIVLLNEVAYDQQGVPGFTGDLPTGSNGDRFARSFLSVSQGVGLSPLTFKTFMAPSNTGIASGYDLDHDGEAVVDFPDPPSAGLDGTPAPQTADGRLYGNDNWGFGTFPGQYAMVLLVNDDFEILEREIRTFQNFLWKDLPGAERPIDPSTGAFWYGDEEWNSFPLSSKSHWDVPVKLPSGHVLHILASHPTPAAFDGPEKRNKLRNRDEIRFWSEYISGSTAIYDDRGIAGGLASGSSFVILGDLNADPDEGSAVGDPIGTLLLSHPSINGAFVPLADSAGIAEFPNLDPDDTAGWGMRVDYVLPSADLVIERGRIVRPAPGTGETVSDHFPVFLDVTIPNM